MTTADLAQGVALLLATLVVGQDFASWAVVHRVLDRLPFEANLPAEQPIYRGFGRLMPVLMPATILTLVATVVISPPGSVIRGPLGLLAIASFVAMVAITIAGNMPLNARILAASPSTPEHEWWTLRRRWDVFHRVRVLVEMIGLISLIVAVTLD